MAAKLSWLRALQLDRWSVVEMTFASLSVGVDETAYWIVFSESHAGNPIEMDANRRVGGHHAEAETFEHFFVGSTYFSPFDSLN